jgi:hypothetical protein
LSLLRLFKWFPSNCIAKHIVRLFLRPIF